MEGVRSFLRANKKGAIVHGSKRLRRPGPSPAHGRPGCWPPGWSGTAAPGKDSWGEDKLSVSWPWGLPWMEPQ